MTQFAKENVLSGANGSIEILRDDAGVPQ